MTALLLAGLMRGEAAQTAGAPPHRQIRAGGWTALAFDAPVEQERSSDAAEAERMLALAERQTRVLCAYVVQKDVLPVALGAVFSDEHALADHVRLHADRFDALMRPLDGQVELCLQVLTAGHEQPEPAEPGDGRSFLAARRQIRDRRRGRSEARARLLDTIGHDLEGLATSQERRMPRDRSKLADWAILVRRGEVDALRDALIRFEGPARQVGASIRLVGPLPGFSFCERPAA